MRNLFFLSFSIVSFGLQAAWSQPQLDSLKVISRQVESDDQRALNYLQIANAYLGQDRDSSKHYHILAQNHAQSASKKLQADIKSLSTEIYRNDWSIDTLKEILQEVIDYYQNNNLEKEILKSLINLGAIHSNRSLYEEAIPYYLDALTLSEILKDTIQKGKISFNLGTVYYNGSMLEQALVKFRESQYLFESVGNQAFAGMALSGVTNVYLNSGRNDSALIYAQKLKQLADTLQYTRLQLNARTVLGSIFNNLEDYESALNTFKEAEPFAAKFGSKLSLVNCYCAMGKSSYFLQQFQQAKDYFETAHDIDIGENNKLRHQFCLKEYAATLRKLGDFEKAVQLLTDHVQYQDTVLSKENKEVVAGLEAKYQSLKKDTEIAQQNLIIEKRTGQRNIFLLGLSLTGLLIWFLIYRYRKNQKLSTEKIQNLEKYQKILVMDSMLQGQEEERQRIAQDLHDGLGTLLVSARLQMQNAQRQIEKLGNIVTLSKTENLIDNACKEVRRIAHDMMPSALVDLGFVDAIGDLVDELKSSRSLQIEFNAPDPIPDLDNATALNLYRIIQEALQNVLKHAEANVVGIQIIVEENNKLLVEISDDGVGFDPEQTEAGLGLNTIRSRVEYLGGQLKLESRRGNGCTYSIEIPVH